MKAEEMRLIFKGKILKDEMTLDEYKITDGLTVHLVKGKSAGAPGDSSSLSGATATDASSVAGSTGAGAGAGAAQPNPFAGMGGMGGMGGFGGMQGMGGMGGGMPPGMGQMNPQMMEQMMGNPMVQ
jgi:ubiquilin